MALSLIQKYCTTCGLTAYHGPDGECYACDEIAMEEAFDEFNSLTVELKLKALYLRLSKQDRLDMFKEGPIE